jgi:hypothetical protein
LVHSLVSTLATEESRANFYETCQQFLELPLEEQAEHVSEFLTTLIGPSRIRKIPALQRGFASLQKVTQSQVKNLTNKLSRKLVSLSSVINTKNLGEFGTAKVPKLLAHYLADKQEILGRALTKEEVRSAQIFFNTTQELVHAPTATAIAAEAEKICKYANKYGENRIFEILKKQKPGRNIAGTVHKSIAESSFKAGKETYKHLFLPQLNKKGNRGTGWHLARNYPEYITKVTKQPNQHGVYEVLWKAPGTVLEKRSTCSPSIWNRVDFIKHARQAYANITKSKSQNNGRYLLNGIDKLGIKWEIVVERKGYLDKLITIYPILTDTE